MLLTNCSIVGFSIRKLALVLLILIFAKTSNAQCSATAAFTHYFQQCSTVQFTDLSTAAPNYNIVQWDWDFDDGNTSTLQNPIHTFAPGVTYLVTLTVTADSSGVTCTDQVTAPVIAPALPSVFFTWDPEPTCLGNPTSFFGTSGGSIVSWYWDFGDGQFSTIQNPVHLYIYADTFDVAMSVIDVNGCSDTIIHQVSVIDIPDVSFTINPDPTCKDAPTLFSGTSTASIAFWDWDFGDGGTSNTQDATHVFTLDGNFLITLTITDIFGCTNTITQTLTVNPLPVPDFQHTGPACMSDSVYFTNFSTSPNGYIAQWEWDFGDGNIQTVNFPANPNVSHQYTNNGTFQATLTVTDSDSCVETTFRQVIIVPEPIADYNYSTACNGDPVDFTDLSSPNGGADIISWYWEFDDPASGINNTSTLQDPSHIFTSAGAFNVILVINNTDNCSDTIVSTVNVNEIPGVDIATDTDTTCVDELTNFYGSGTNIVTWSWDFGDGGTSVLQDPQHSYASAATYVVTLSVVDQNGCTNDTSRTVYVNPLPFADFNHSVPSCSGSIIDFFDLSSTPNGYMITWHWYFGDGTDTIVNFPDPPNVSHIYSGPGNYMVSLAVTNSNGCIDSSAVEVPVGQGPAALFETNGPPCEDNLLQFMDLSQGFGYNIQAWLWNFDDPTSGSNNTSTLQNPYHIFNNPGAYNVFLEVTSANGCIDTITQNVSIEPPPNVYFTSSGPEHCQNDTVYFTVDPDSTDIPAIVSYFWDFGDPASGSSDTSSLQNPWHIFSTSGTFTITLTVTDTTGCSNSVSSSVLINEIPTADFEFQMNCLNDSTLFVDQSIAAGLPINTWTWDFGDPASGNNTSSLQNPYHLFTGMGQYTVTLTVEDGNGCDDVIYKYVTIYDTPTAGFTFEQVCEPPGTVHFSDGSSMGSSGSPIQSWLWEIDNGYFSTEVNPVYTYNQGDSCYVVTLTVTDNNLCTSSFYDTVCVFEQMEVEAAANTVCHTQRTNFTSSYTPANDSILTYTWDFGDGTPANTSIFDTTSYVYNEPGTYIVTLEAMDIHNCTSITYLEILVDPLPIPAFATDTAFCDDPTHFFDESLGNGTFINSWYWDFGDPSSGANNNSNLPNPSHAYSPTDSTYLVTLIVGNSYGCTDSIVKEVIKGPCILSEFEVITDPICTGNEICFDDNSLIFGSSGMISAWEWDFGDGNTINYNTPIDTICHIYNDPGDYTVMLVVTANVQGASFNDTTYHGIHVNQGPTADFRFEAPCTNHETRFINESEGNGTILSAYYWNFNDPASANDTSMAKDPTYEFSQPGYYTVTLITENGYGCTDSIRDTIEIYPPPVARFDFSMSCKGAPTFFLDQSDTSGTAISHWYWNFGDINSTRDTSTLRNPIYTYDSAAPYNVIFIVSDFNYCTDTLLRTVNVNPIPNSDFVVDDYYENLQGQIQCVNYTDGAIIYEWDFGNGETSEEENPVTSYTEDGLYIIRLVSWNEFNCPDTAYVEYEFMFKGLYIPNALAPTSPVTSVQDFEPKGYNLRSYSIEVYSTWGVLLWKSIKIDNNGQPLERWDGTYKDAPMPVGNYVWKAYATFKDNTTWPGMEDENGNFSKTGTITLIR